MNVTQTGIESLDLERLNDKDKAELRQFLANEQQRSQIQSREFTFSTCMPVEKHKFLRPRNRLWAS